MSSLDRAVELFPTGGKFSARIDLWHRDKELVLPVTVLWVLLEEPALQATLLDVALDDEHIMHQLVLDYDLVDHLVFARDRWEHFDCFLIEMIMLVLGQFLPPLLAARQWHFVEEICLALREADVRLQTMESAPHRLFN